MSRRVRRKLDRLAAISGVCTCRKVQYFEFHQAEHAAARALARGEGDHRIYVCPTQARTWHITHLAPMGVRVEEE